VPIWNTAIKPVKKNTDAAKTGRHCG